MKKNIQTVTQWFRDENPVHVGIYEVRNNGSISQKDRYFLHGWYFRTDVDKISGLATHRNRSMLRYWMGTEWLVEKGGGPSMMGRHKSHEWRGVVKELK